MRQRGEFSELRRYRSCTNQRRRIPGLKGSLGPIQQQGLWSDKMSGDFLYQGCTEEHAPASSRRRHTCSRSHAYNEITCKLAAAEIQIPQLAETPKLLGNGPCTQNPAGKPSRERETLTCLMFDETGLLHDCPFP